MDWSNSSANESGLKTYEVKQLDHAGNTLAAVEIDATSGELAAKKLDDVAVGTESIKVCLNGDVMNEMGVDYWQQRIRRRK